jgi:hypothetical protein
MYPRYTTKLALFIVAFFVVSGCSTRPINQAQIDTNPQLSKQQIAVKDVEWIKTNGGGPSARSKVLFPEKDSDTIRKMVDMLNSANKQEPTADDLRPAIRGNPSVLTIKLKDNRSINIKHIYTYSQDNGRKAVDDRVLLGFDDNVQETAVSPNISNTLFGSVPMLAQPISVTPSSIKPGQKIVISGDGSTKKEILIYVADFSQIDWKYLLAKVPTSFGAWKWEGTINGREIKTYDGQEIKLVKDHYSFDVEDGVSMTGIGDIDLSSTKQLN